MSRSTPDRRPVSRDARRPARRVLAVTLAGGLLLAPGAATAAPATVPTGTAARAGEVDPAWLDLSREVLPDGDGWASHDGGTTGGSAAADVDVHVVRTWDELRTALGGPTASGSTEPRIVLVEGTIQAFGFDDAGSGLPTCDDFAAQVQVEDPDDPRPFSMAEYIATYDPETWGWDPPTGPLEDARVAATRVQRAQVQQRIGSDVTLLGLGDDARVVGAHLQVQGVSNVIIRNLHVADAYDCFPEWDPEDTAGGTWNSLYDNISVHTSSRVWVDHVTLDDGDHPPHALPTVFGKPFEVHDGLLDVTHESDLVTVSYSVLRDHDKTNLIGSGDGREVLDGGRLRTTWHHNLWEDVGQRLPRVRFGDVDVYNNLYRISPERADLFDYAWGAGVRSSIVADRNVFELPEDVPAARIIKRWGGEQIQATRTLVNGVEVDVLAAYTAANPDAPLADGARWDPVAAGLRTEVHEVDEVRDVVLDRAGAGRLLAAPEPDPAPEPTPTPTPAPAPAPTVAPTAGPQEDGAPGDGTGPGDGLADGGTGGPDGTDPLAATGAHVALAGAAAALLAGGGAALLRVRARAVTAP